MSLGRVSSRYSGMAAMRKSTALKLEKKSRMRAGIEILQSVQGLAPSSTPGVVRRGPVDRRHLPPHRAQIGRELPAVVDGIEEHTPKKVLDRVFQGRRSLNE